VEVVQASVHSFDPQTGGGSVLLDDGRRVPFEGEVFARSGLRVLRTGQRVTVELSPAEDGSIRLRWLAIRGVPGW
jgi:cold shock CspA family protein